jgi:glycosyltransferase involved in cell wall biosynthesis
MRKLLFISPFRIFPPAFGGADRTYHLVKGLAANYRVFLLHTNYDQLRSVVYQPEAIPNVSLHGVGPARRWAQLFNPLLVLEGLRLIGRERPDLIMAEALWAGLHTLILHALTGMPYVLDEFNVEYLRYQSMGRRWIGLIRCYERLICHWARRVFCVYEGDRQALLALGVPPEKLVLVPNGADLTRFRPDPSRRGPVRAALGLVADDPLVLFFGKLNYQPNREAVGIIAESLLPPVLRAVPNAAFVVCGEAPPQDTYQHQRLFFPGFVPRIEDYINAADVVIVPLISGGGSSRLKVVQALACGRPVVSTSLGAEAFAALPGAITIADDWDTFAACIVRQLAEGRAPAFDRAAFAARYDWQRIVERAAAAIETALAE